MLSDGEKGSAANDASVNPVDEGQKSFPLVSLVAVNAHGMTFRSRSEFNIGSRLELGIHVRMRGRSENSRFVPISGYVVVSSLSSHEGNPLYEVTLLFDEIDPQDAQLLTKVPDAIESRGEPVDKVGKVSQLDAEQDGPRSVIGLN